MSSMVRPSILGNHCFTLPPARERSVRGVNEHRTSQVEEHGSGVRRRCAYLGRGQERERHPGGRVGVNGVGAGPSAQCRGRWRRRAAINQCLTHDCPRGLVSHMEEPETGMPNRRSYPSSSGRMNSSARPMPDAR